MRPGPHSNLNTMDTGILVMKNDKKGQFEVSWLLMAVQLGNKIDFVSYSHVTHWGGGGGGGGGI